jgi:hypothetical protein
MSHIAATEGEKPSDECEQSNGGHDDERARHG